MKTRLFEIKFIFDITDENFSLPIEREYSAGWCKNFKEKIETWNVHITRGFKGSTVRKHYIFHEIPNEKTSLDLIKQYLLENKEFEKYNI